MQDVSGHEKPNLTTHTAISTMFMRSDVQFKFADILNIEKSK